jgi:hypothetical protein
MLQHLYGCLLIADAVHLTLKLITSTLTTDTAISNICDRQALDALRFVSGKQQAE